jgi:ubiquinone/menaquinone biosynthesis C-methylase UbiE
MALHHLPNHEKAKAAREISRVLKDDGKAMIGDIIFFDQLDWSDATGENILEKIKKAFGEDLRPEDVCCNIKRIIEMLREEYPTRAENLKKFFEESGFQVQVEKVKYWFGILSAIQPSNMILSQR